MSQAPLSAEEIFADIGLKLRSARESQGLTVEEISSRTRINRVFLEKIESGDMEGLPSIAFVRGFVRNFMQALELDDPDLLADLQRIGASPAEVIASSEPSAYYQALTEDQSLPIGKIAVAVIRAVPLPLWCWISISSRCTTTRWGMRLVMNCCARNRYACKKLYVTPIPWHDWGAMNSALYCLYYRIRGAR